MRRAFRLMALLGVLTLLGSAGLQHIVYGDPTHVQNRFDQLSDSQPSHTATNLEGFTITDTSQPLGSIAFQFCAESPLPGFPCTAPSGFDASGVVLSAQSGNTGFSVAGNSTANTVILTRTPNTPTTGPNTYQLDNIVNPNTAESYYMRIYIYPTTDGSGTETQNGGVALATNNAVVVNAEVPPFLKFCTGLEISNFDCSTATGFTVNLGELSSHQSSTGTSQFTVATNAESGYTVTLNGSTLTSGNNVIPNLTTPSPSLIGASQFGINLRANNAPSAGNDPAGPGAATVTANYNVPNRFTYNNADTLVSSPTTSDNQTFTVSYLTNVSSNQPAGAYVTTMTYICLANF